MENQPNKTVWAIDPVHSRVRFDAKYLLITSVSGWFRELEGTVTSSTADFSDCDMEVVVYASSIYTGVEERDKHLLSSDFFDASRHPTIRFRSNSVRRDGEKITVDGVLTIKGISHPIQFDAQHLGSVKDPQGNTKAGFEVDLVFDRKLFDITWNQFFDQQGILISDQVHIHADIQLLRIR